MCIEIRVDRDNDSFFKTSYQRAHYYENLQDWANFSVERSSFRPELYYSDPIIKKKLSTYRHDYNVKKSVEENVEFYGKFNLTSKHTLKNLYDEYKCKPVTFLKYDRTLSGLHYKDPSRSNETKLLENFCKESSSVTKEINNCSSEKPCYIEYTEPYTTTYQSHFKDTVVARRDGIAKDDVITYYNKREKNKRPFADKIHSVNFRSFFKVPLNGDSSVYQQDYLNAEIKDAYLGEVCQFPSYFQTIKNKIKEIPGAYTTEQQMIGIGKPTRYII